MRKTILTLLASIFFACMLNAQTRSFNTFDFGVGMGLNYGGFGFSMAVAPIPFLSIEGNFGFNMADPVVGGALNLYVIPKDDTKTYSLALKSMYGYNAVILVTEGSMESKTFYGPSFGLSNELRFGSRKRGGLNIDLLFPIRSGDVEDYRDELDENGYETTALMPFTISIGYHFEF